MVRVVRACLFFLACQAPVAAHALHDDIAPLFAAASAAEPFRQDPLLYRLHPEAAPPRPLFSALITRPLEALPRLHGLADQAFALTQLSGLAHFTGALLTGDQVALHVGPRCQQDAVAEVFFGENPFAQAPAEVRDALKPMACALAYAERMRQRAFRNVPAELDRARLIRQILEGGPLLFEEPDFRVHLTEIEFPALVLALLELSAAAETLAEHLAAWPVEPVRWETHTTLGRIIIDTTATDRVYQGERPLFLLDMQGNDSYRFDTAPHAISILIDMEGDDQYRPATDGSDGAAAVLGLSVLWDEQGNDVYEAGRLAQAAALYGASLLVDRQGNDQYRALGYAQGFALGGIAVLADEDGNDVYEAVTHAQSSAGPFAATVLRDRRGDDRYSLLDTPLLRPSPQAPARNVSMGQGAGWGWRADQGDARSLPGGVALLFDGGGHDHYRAEVFAQGVGYWHGAGVLVDEGGANQFELAWYGLGAATHRAVGALLVRGMDTDDYRVAHTAALGFAHDRSFALAFDAGGKDVYTLPENGLGAVLGQGVALFIDRAGDDVYRMHASSCRGLGLVLDAADAMQPLYVGLALFGDYAGRDTYLAPGCPGAVDGNVWPPPSDAAARAATCLGRGVDRAR